MKNHNFIFKRNSKFSTELKCFICEKCNTEAYLFKNKDIFNIKYEKYVNLTCNELMIKNIID